MPNTRRETPQHYDWIPTQGEFIRALTLAWLRVGDEVLTLVAYALKQSEPIDVRVSERRTTNEN